MDTELQQIFRSMQALSEKHWQVQMFNPSFLFRFFLLLPCRCVVFIRLNEYNKITLLLACAMSKTD